MTVLVAGCPRSGTSILGELFESHHGFKYAFEPKFYELPDPMPDNYVAKLPCEDEPHESGLPFGAATLKHMRNPKVIWIVRHPYDTIVSLRPGMEDWSHPPRPDMWEALMDCNVDVRSAWFWWWHNKAGYNTLSPHYTVKYESLVKDPFFEVSKILDFVGVDWTARIGEYCQRITNKSGENEANLQDMWRREHTNHVGRWKETNINKESLVRAIVVSTAAEFGYSL